VDAGAITRAVVAHDPLDGDAVAAVERDGAAQEADRGGGLFVGQDLDVGEAGGVVDADVDELPADGLLAVLARAALQPPVAVNTVPGPAGRDPSERLDVDLQQLARVAALVTVGWSGGSSRPSLPSPTRKSTAKTVESAIAKHNAISAPVIRSRRSSTITSTSWCAVRDRLGRRRAIQQPSLSFDTEATDPLATRALTPRRRPRPPPRATNPAR
jgi:hypothetical protein